MNRAEGERFQQKIYVEWGDGEQRPCPRTPVMDVKEGLMRQRKKVC